jgi:hypothetical protein
MRGSLAQSPASRTCAGLSPDRPERSTATPPARLAACRWRHTDQKQHPD